MFEPSKSMVCKCLNYLFHTNRGQLAYYISTAPFLFPGTLNTLSKGFGSCRLLPQIFLQKVSSFKGLVVPPFPLLSILLFEYFFYDYGPLVSLFVFENYLCFFLDSKHLILSSPGLHPSSFLLLFLIMLCVAMLKYPL